MGIWEITPQIASPEGTEKALETLKGLDESSLMKAAIEMPKHVIEAVKKAKDSDEGDIPLERAKIHLFGLGGSAIAGDLIGDMLSPKRKIDIHRGTIPPRDPRGLVISSYSGNTYEIVESALKLTGGIKSVVCITSGGALSKLAYHWCLPQWSVPSGLLPRSAIGWFIGYLMGIMEKWRIIQKHTTEFVVSAAERLHKSLSQTEPHQHPLIRASLPIAQSMLGKNVLIFHTLRCTGAAKRLEAQINENGKHPAFSIMLPEGLHNSIEGIAGGDPNAWTLIYISDHLDPPILRDGMERSADFLKDKGYQCVAFPSAGNDQFELTLSRVMLSDFVSIFLAGLKGIDPAPIPAITELKITPSSIEDDDEHIQDADGRPVVSDPTNPKNS